MVECGSGLSQSARTILYHDVSNENDENTDAKNTTEEIEIEIDDANDENLGA